MDVAASSSCHLRLASITAVVAYPIRGSLLQPRGTQHGRVLSFTLESVPAASCRHTAGGRLISIACCHTMMLLRLLRLGCGCFAGIACCISFVPFILVGSVHIFWMLMLDHLLPTLLQQKESPDGPSGRWCASRTPKTVPLPWLQALQAVGWC